MSLTSPRSRLVIALALTVGWLGAMATFSVYLSHSQSNARQAVIQRLAARAQSGAEFANLYVQDLLTRERTQAHLWLAGPKVTMVDLQNASSAMEVPASVLLDRAGRVLEVLPAKPALIGRVITGKYPHLAAGVAGRSAVSNVVPSAARGLPVVGLAMPFASAAGRRVFSGAFAVSMTPLGAYMSHLVATPGRQVYMIDANSTLISASKGSRPHETLGEADRPLANDIRTQSSGSYATAAGSRFFETAKIPGTPWQIVMSVPTSMLFVSVDGATHWLAWVALFGLAFAGLVIIAIGSRLVRSRQRLATVNQELDRLARIDPLTELSNRRDIEERLSTAASYAKRHQTDLSVLILDIDHFKRINDSHGHQIGDAVLAGAARAIQSSLRLEDVVGRWGGEEFLAVLPHTDARQAMIVAERLRLDMTVPLIHDGVEYAITVTIGVADWASDDTDDVIRRADAALYAGKTGGRNTVELIAAEQA